MADKGTKAPAAAPEKPEEAAEESLTAQSHSGPAVTEAIVHPLVLLSVTGALPARAAWVSTGAMCDARIRLRAQTTTTAWPRTLDAASSASSSARRPRGEVRRPPARALSLLLGRLLNAALSRPPPSLPPNR